MHAAVLQVGREPAGPVGAGEVAGLGVAEQPLVAEPLPGGQRAALPGRREPHAVEALVRRQVVGRDAGQPAAPRSGRGAGPRHPCARQARANGEKTLNGLAVALGDPAGRHGVRGAGPHQRDVAQRLLDRGVAAAPVGPGVGGDVHAGRLHLADEAGTTVGRVAGPEHQRAVERLLQVGEAVEQELPAGRAGRLPEPGVDDEDREDVAVGAGGIDGGEQCGMVGEPEVAAEPQQRRRHLRSVGRARGIPQVSGRRSPGRSAAGRRRRRGRCSSGCCWM